MFALLQQFQSYGIHLPAQYSSDAIEQLFRQPLDSAELSRFVKDHKWLEIQYSAYCTQLREDLGKANQPPGLIQRIEAALLMAEFLERIYERYLNEKDKIALMRRNQGAYRRMLKLPERVLDISLPSYSKQIHEHIAFANRMRLLTVRVRRLFLATAPVLSSFEQYRHFVGLIEAGTGPVFAYLAWLTLLPRLLKNLTLLTKHLVRNKSMRAEEKSLSPGARLIAQLEFHWFELANDIVTISINLTNCFILVGAANAYLGVGLLAFDVVLASCRAYYELSHLYALKKTYEAMGEADPAFVSYLDKRIHYEQVRHAAAVANAVLILLAAVMTSPLLSFAPVIPLIGAALAVLTTIANMVICQKIDNSKPSDEVSYKPLVAQGMFRPAIPRAEDAPPQVALEAFPARALTA